MHVTIVTRPADSPLRALAAALALIALAVSRADGLAAAAQADAPSAPAAHAHGGGSATKTSEPPPLFEGLGDHHKKIATTSERAQRYFDQGLTLYYGFNLEEATRAFQEAARLDPDAIMAWWGIALAAGPNYNSPIDEARNRRAVEATQTALALAPKASQVERDYVEALSTRYSSDPKRDRAGLDRAFAEAMKKLAAKHPDDLDAQTLYAESLMNLRPWDLWTFEGEPQPGTAEIVATLEGVLARAPDHPGANHLYVHAVEASPQPGKGLAAADRLTKLVPAAGHLVHMPAHIYMRTGRYAQASEANVRAIAADKAYFELSEPSFEYRAMYYPHNIDFLWSAASMEGRSAESLQAARALAAATPAEMVREMVDMEPGMVAPVFVLARFGRWDDVLAEPAPPSDLPFATGSWHFARGLALARKGELDRADTELAALRKVTAATPPARTVQIVNKAKEILTVESEVLAGEIAAARGEYDVAIPALEKAVRMQDRLRYMEPPPFYYPIRQSLGAVLLAAGKPREAEAVYRRDLEMNPDNGWSLYGLEQSLRAQGKGAEADEVQQRFVKAWARADVTLAASRF
jgi:tetratricopeptide (TPR) repeat protein